MLVTLSLSEPSPTRRVKVVLLTQRSLSFHIRRVREYHVYIMASRSGVLYIGVTNDLTRRVSEHQRKAVPGFTARYRVSRLVHFESFDQVRDAIAREKQLKGWRREKKIALIEKANSAWRDLSEGWFDSRDPSTSSG